MKTKNENLVNPVILSKRYGFTPLEKTRQSFDKRISLTGFTLIEMVVAIGILAMMIAFSSVIFSFSIDAHRVASANAEIMQKARALTGQLNRDFAGLRKDSPMTIIFQQSGQGIMPNRYDQILFFADGDFSSWQLYNNKAIRGNTARIYYGHAFLDSQDPVGKTGRDELKLCLARNAHILTTDSSLNDGRIPTSFTGFSAQLNNEYEYDLISLAEWKTIDSGELDSIIYAIIKSDLVQTPAIRTINPNLYHQLLAQGVGSFSVQTAYWQENISNDWELRWFPSHDPDGDDDPNDSHFTRADENSKNEDYYGLLFNLPSTSEPDFYTSIAGLNTRSYGPPLTGSYIFPDFPDALKFTFRLYDSKGIIKEGITFTHIVYLKD